MKKPYFKSTVGALGIASLLAFSSASHANLMLSLSDGTTTINVADGGSSDFNPLAGAITFIGAVGSNWFLNVSTALGTGAYQGGFGLDLHSLNSSLSAGTLNLAMSETDLTWGAPGATPAHVGGKIGGVTDGTVSYGLFTDNSNTPYGKGATVFTGTGQSAFSNEGGTVIDLSDPFSMSLFLDIEHTGPGQTSFNFTGQVPEPSTLALTALVLLGFGTASLRRCKK